MTGRYAWVAVVALAVLGLGLLHGIGPTPALADAPVICGDPQHPTAPTYDSKGHPQCPTRYNVTGTNQTPTITPATPCAQLLQAMQAGTAASMNSKGVSAQQSLDAQYVKAASDAYNLRCGAAAHGGASAATTAPGGFGTGYVPYTAKPGTTTWTQQYLNNSATMVNNAMGVMAQEEADQEAAAEQAQEEQAAADAQREAEEAQRRAQAAAQDAQRRAALDNPFSGGGTSHADGNPFAQGSDSGKGNKRLADTDYASNNPFADADKEDSKEDKGDHGCGDYRDDFVDAYNTYVGDMSEKHPDLAQVAYREMEMVKSDAARHGCDVSAYDIPPKPKVHVKTKGSNGVGTRG